MLNINTNKSFTTQGYHYNERYEKKFVLINVALFGLIVKVKLQKGKTLHLIANEPHFKYWFTENFVCFCVYWKDKPIMWELDEQLKKVWFE